MGARSCLFNSNLMTIFCPDFLELPSFCLQMTYQTGVFYHVYMKRQNRYEIITNDNVYTQLYYDM